MQIQNLSKSTLTLPTGEVIKAGEVAEVKKLDEKHHVIAAWLEAGLIEKSSDEAQSETEADKTTEINKTAETEAEKAQAKTKTTAKE